MTQRPCCKIISKAHHSYCIPCHLSINVNILESQQSLLHRGSSFHITRLYALAARGKTSIKLRFDFSFSTYSKVPSYSFFSVALANVQIERDEMRLTAAKPEAYQLLLKNLLVENIENQYFLK